MVMIDDSWRQWWGLKCWLYWWRIVEYDDDGCLNDDDGCLNDDDGKYDDDGENEDDQGDVPSMR